MWTYAGQTVAVIDRHTGLSRQAQIFVAVLGASNYTYLEASWTQTLPDWVMAHVRTFAFLGGCPAIVVPDNLKSGVSRACRYDPDINPTYAAMAAHYGVAVIPARAVKPRDKAKVEVGVQIVERWILARLRQQTFFSLDELQRRAGPPAPHAQRPALPEAAPAAARAPSRSSNAPPWRRCHPAPTPYTEWSTARVNIDYHIAVDERFYSVPYRLIRHTVDVGLSAHTVEVFHRRQRVASHARLPNKGQFATVAEHMPPQHQRHAEWTPQRLIQWARKTGPATGELIETVLRSRAHVQQGFRACLGILPPGQKLRRSAPGGRRTARVAARHHPLQKRRVDPQTRPRSAAVTRGPESGCRAGPLPIRRPRRMPISAAPTTTIEEITAMLLHPTLDKLRRLRLSGMVAALEEQQHLSEISTLSFEERLGLLVDREMSVRDSRRLTNRLRRARLRQAAVLEDIDYNRRPRPG